MFQARTEDISAERKPVAFGDLRGFIEALKAQGELAEIDAEVDWNIELGTIMRLAQAPGTGPVKEHILKGADVDLYEFPTPHWNRLDGGRYLLTYGGCVTKDPETGVMNVGIYRGMVASHDRIPILVWRAQHIGHHYTAWQNGGEAEMPIAVAIGWEPSLGFCA